jgi:hypothetical protein
MLEAVALARALTGLDPGTSRIVLPVALQTGPGVSGTNRDRTEARALDIAAAVVTPTTLPSPRSA